MSNSTAKAIQRQKDRLLTENQIAVLEALAVYRYLSVDHVCRLLDKERSFVYKFITPALCTDIRPLVKRIEYPVSFYGKRPYVFYLTKLGALKLSLISGKPTTDFKVPRVINAFNKDYPHRMAFIDIHIGLRKWLAQIGEAPPDVALTYFDRVRAMPRTTGGREIGFRTATHIQIDASNYIEPDGIARFIVGGKVRLCMIEMHKDRPPGEITTELDKHISALAAGTLSGIFNHPTSHIVLSIYENQKTMQTVISRLKAIPDFADFQGDFMFNTLDQVRSDFSKGWIMANGESAWLF
jgi:hypothetical protein